MPSIYSRIVTDNLVFAVDAVDPNSYTSGSYVWNDMSLNRYTGSITGSLQYSDSNKGIYFDANSGSYCKFTGITPVQVTSASLSINIIFKLPSDYQDGSNTLFAHDFESVPGGGGNSGWRVDLYPNGANSIAFTLSGLGGYYNTNLAILPNTIYNVTFTVSGSTVKCYNKDVLSYTYFPIASYPIHSANTYVFNRVFFGSTAPMKATIYAARVYTKALSEEEIRQNYIAHKSRFE